VCNSTLAEEDKICLSAAAAAAAATATVGLTLPAIRPLGFVAPSNHCNCSSPPPPPPKRIFYPSFLSLSTAADYSCGRLCGAHCELTHGMSVLHRHQQPRTLIGQGLFEEAAADGDGVGMVRVDKETFTMSHFSIVFATVVTSVVEPTICPER
jgi:hypothetical protein